MTYDASNPEHIAKAKRDEEDVEKDLDFVLSQPRGRRWVYNLIWGHGRLTGQSFVATSNESTAFNEGVRAVPALVHEQIKRRNPSLYMKMLEENHFDE